MKTKACLLALLLLQTISAHASSRHSGKDLLYSWNLASTNIGSIQVTGTYSSSEEFTTIIDGRFGSNAMVLKIGDVENNDTSWNAYIELDGNTARVTNLKTGWTSYFKPSAIDFTLIQERDLFSMRLPLGRPEFVNEDPYGIQTWKYQVRGGQHYEVRIKPMPLRLIERTTFDKSGEKLSTYIYDDFWGLSGNVALPRQITIEHYKSNNENLALCSFNSVSSRPPLPRIPPIRKKIIDFYNTGEKITQEEIFIEITTIAADYENDLRQKLFQPYTGSSSAHQNLSSAQSELLQAKFALMAYQVKELKTKYGTHPLIDISLARLSLATGDTKLASRSIRAAFKNLTLATYIKRIGLPAAARVGAVEYSSSNDAKLLEWAIRQAAPSSPSDLNQNQSEIYAEVVAIAHKTYMRHKQNQQAQELLSQAFLLDPLNPKIQTLGINEAVARGDVERAIHIADLIILASDSSIASLLTKISLLKSLGQLQDAENLYLAAIDAYPANFVLKLKLADVQWQQKKWIEAQETYDELLAWLDLSHMDAENEAEIWGEIARNYAVVRINMAQARRLINLALAVYPQNPRFLDTRGLILMHYDRYDDATRVFRKTLLLHPDPQLSAEILGHLNKAEL